MPADTAALVDHYKVLSVSRGASEAQIRSAHRALILRYHPDRAPEGRWDFYSARAQEINAARDALLDPIQRHRLDEELGRRDESAKPSVPTAADPPRGRPHHHSQYPTEDTEKTYVWARPAQAPSPTSANNPGAHVAAGRAAGDRGVLHHAITGVVWIVVGYTVLFMFALIGWLLFEAIPGIVIFLIGL